MPQTRNSSTPPLMLWSLALFAGFVVTASIAFMSDVVSGERMVLAALTAVSALARLGFGLLLDS